MKLVRIKISTILTYIILGVLILLLVKTSLLQEYMMWVVLIFVLFINRELLSFFWIPKNIEFNVFDWKKFRIDTSRGFTWISRIDSVIIVFREVIFPFFLVTTIVFLLIQQLDFFGIADFFSDFPWIWYSIFTGFGISAFIVIFRESSTSEYLYKKIHSFSMRWYVFSNIVISLFTSAFVFLESSTMGNLSIPISIISWVFIFSLWILLLSEEEV